MWWLGGYWSHWLVIALAFEVKDLMEPRYQSLLHYTRPFCRRASCGEQTASISPSRKLPRTGLAAMHRVTLMRTRSYFTEHQTQRYVCATLRNLGCVYSQIWCVYSQNFDELLNGGAV